MVEIPAKVDAALTAATKTELIFALRAMTTVRLWDTDERELREILRAGLRADECSCDEVLAGLGVEPDYVP